ncbi:hypothetical protein, partial [Flagellimonas onchidii]|uniref:hypothetical protein n=1 Tax=Flagellimonas onchidii TaxID=2562684 RepID=UPI00197AFA9A
MKLNDRGLYICARRISRSRKSHLTGVLVVRRIDAVGAYVKGIVRIGARNSGELVAPVQVQTIAGSILCVVVRIRDV